MDSTWSTPESVVKRRLEARKEVNKHRNRQAVSADVSMSKP